MLKLAFALVALMVAAAQADAQDLTWRKDIQPLVQTHCGVCHGANAPVYEDWNLDRDKWTKQNIGPRMDTHAYFMRHVVWPATGSVMRRLDDGKDAPGGKPGNMFEFLGGANEERGKNLQTIKTWLGEGAWNLNRWETRGNVPGITKEQMDKIKAKY